MNVRLSNRSLLNVLALALVGISLVLLANAIAGASPPKIKTEFGGATVAISVDKAWSLFSGDCLTIRWNLEGIKSIYIDGQGEIGWGEIEFCPSLSAASPQFEITAQDGTLQVFTLDIHLFADGAADLSTLCRSSFCRSRWHYIMCAAIN